MKPELIVNLKTAKARGLACRTSLLDAPTAKQLGIGVPPALFARADEVIE